VAWKVLELTSDLYLGVNQLSGVISRDQTLTARILRISNSAYFQRCREVKTVEQAMTVLGNSRIRGIVVAASLGGILYRTPMGRSLWQHALGVGLAARDLIERIPGMDSEEAFVAGLLHDIGKGLFDCQHPELFVQAASLASSDPEMSTWEAEELVLGLNHVEAGERVAQSWNLPESITAAILHHHDPDNGGAHVQLCAAVSLADLCCLKAGIGPVSKPELDPLDSGAARLLGIEAGDFEQLEQDFLEKMDRDRALFGFR
jgi:putative nucleotidyltransferase with HDIG domain